MSITAPWVAEMNLVSPVLIVTSPRLCDGDSPASRADALTAPACAARHAPTSGSLPLVSTKFPAGAFSLPPPVTKMPPM